MGQVGEIVAIAETGSETRNPAIVNPRIPTLYFRQEIPLVAETFDPLSPCMPEFRFVVMERFCRSSFCGLSALPNRGPVRADLRSMIRELHPLPGFHLTFDDRFDPGLRFPILYLSKLTLKMGDNIMKSRFLMTP